MNGCRGKVRDELGSVNRANAGSCVCHSKGLVFLDPRKIGIRKVILSYLHFHLIGLSGRCVEDELDLTGLLIRKLVTKFLF